MSDAIPDECAPEHHELYGYLQLELALIQQQGEPGVTLRFSNDGKPYIQWPQGNGPANGQTPSFADPAHRARALAAQRMNSRDRKRMSRQAFNDGYAQAAADYAPKIIELEAAILEIATKRDKDGEFTASDRQIDRALKLSKDIKDRLGGKAVQQIDVDKTSETRVSRIAAAAARAVDEIEGKIVSPELEAGAG